MEDMTSSQSEKHIYEECLSLMETLTDRFYDWCEMYGIDMEDLSEEERFCTSFSNTEIVERLFLLHTTHSGGTSQRMKCKELGIDPSENISFGFEIPEE